jgi:hypothetical protein
VLSLLELTNIRREIVGPRGSGLSTEQRKRLTIGQWASSRSCPRKVMWSSSGLRDVMRRLIRVCFDVPGPDRYTGILSSSHLVSTLMSQSWCFMPGVELVANPALIFLDEPTSGACALVAGPTIGPGVCTHPAPAYGPAYGLLIPWEAPDCVYPHD